MKISSEGVLLNRGIRVQGNAPEGGEKEVSTLKKRAYDLLVFIVIFLVEAVGISLCCWHPFPGKNYGGITICIGFMLWILASAAREDIVRQEDTES